MARVTRANWPADQAVQTLTTAVRQEGETDLEYEHRNWKVQTSARFHQWGKRTSQCRTFDSVLSTAGLAARPDYAAGYNYKTLGELRGERTRKAFETFKVNCATYLNQQARRHGLHSEEVRNLIAEVGLDPQLGVPERKTVEIQVTATYPWSYEVEKDGEGVERPAEETLRRQGLYNVTDKLYRLLDDEVEDNEGSAVLTVVAQDAPTEGS